jgi:propionyl-CoA carboxylase beta chain
MNSKSIGADIALAWPSAEIAVMGAPGAVQILHGRRLADIDDEAARAAEQATLVEEYETRFANPYVAAERGYVDDVIPASETRHVLASALRRLVYKREPSHSRRHANTPL